MNRPTVPQTYNCSNCNHQFGALKESNQSTPEPPRVGDVLLCSNCGLINVMSLIGLRAMTEEEFNALQGEERRDLTFAQRVIMQHKKN